MERDVPRLVDVARNARPQGPPDRHLEAVRRRRRHGLGLPARRRAQPDEREDRRRRGRVRREPVALDVDPGPVLQRAVEAVDVV